MLDLPTDLVLALRDAEGGNLVWLGSSDHTAKLRDFMQFELQKLQPLFRPRGDAPVTPPRDDLAMAAPDAPDGVRTGVCVVRAEGDGPTGLRITVTCRQDVGDPRTQTIWNTVDIDTALTHVRDFLETFDRAGR